MQEYPRYRSIKRCQKCGAETDCIYFLSKTRWIKPTIPCSCGAKTEHMCRTCICCGYSWAEAVMGGIYELDPEYRKKEESPKCGFWSKWF